ncbi:entericidin A/B family lipoprotein [Shimia litoralis]|uniref:Entericidin A/B family lipoprotein n=1 Tax=Shimia litoralis TaxID=420403 RepID=A0A4U7N0T7_9RHOB|nr:entericidin A/B family lipoprotein [Shimia litoralis]TKZ19232.1 entericidin A/B family lipoprotein [Shimia litoralis]
MTRVLIIGLAVLTLAACETTKGAGKDIQKAGDAITEAATDVQKTL